MSFAQSINDTLSEVIVYGDYWKDNNQGNRRILDSNDLKTDSYQNLAESFSRLKALNFTSNGVSGYAIPRIRGTRPEHTALLWNGININHAGLGQANLFLVPNQSFDHAEIELGNSAAQYGSGAIGAVISLEDSPNFLEKNDLSISGSIGSFERYNSGFSWRKSSDKIYSSISLYDSRAKNDFSYINHLDFREPTLKQANADYRQTGLRYSIAGKLNSKNIIKFNSWIHDSEAGIQAQMNAKNPNDRQSDLNQRYLLNYQNYSSIGLTESSVYFTSDAIDFNGMNTNINRVGIRQSIDSRINNYYAVKIGLGSEVFQPVYEGQNLEVQEMRNSVFLLQRFNWKQFYTNVNFRYTHVENYNTPINPHISMGYKLVHSKLLDVKLSTSYSTGFRVPTLNERYWRPGGNLNIKPERSEQYEVSMSGRLSKIRFGLSLFDIYVKDVVIWNIKDSVWSEPDNKWFYSIYSPENQKSLRSQGLNLEVKSSKLTFGRFKISEEINYNYTISHIGENEELTSYIPRNSFSAVTQLDYISMFLVINHSFTDERWFQNTVLEEYHLFNLILGNSFNYKNHQLSISGEVRNLFDREYETFLNRAMPGRYFLINLKLNLNLNEKF